MANFFGDNPDIRFHLGALDLTRVIALRESRFEEHALFPEAPEDAADALDNYRRVLEIVGEIADEFDQEVAPFKKLGEGHYLISGRTEIKSLNETLHLELPAGDYETLAGFLISELGDLPRAGEQLQYRNLKFTVRQAEARAVKEVELFVDVAPE